MADGILGLGSSGASSLNQELIDTLKAAERKSTVEPIETSIEDIGTEKEVYETIDAKVTELLDSVKVFDLFVTGGATAFDQKSATATGDSVIFDAPDVSLLNEGVTTVDIKNLAQKDVFQSNLLDDSAVDTDIYTDEIDIGIITIAVGDGESVSIDTTPKLAVGESGEDGYQAAVSFTYETLAEKIDSLTGVNASLEQVGTDSYRLVIKSSESGVDNALTISGTAADDAILGFNKEEIIDGVTISNHILEAADMTALVDGVEYNVSSNSLEVDGLKIVASETGVSSINISKDNASIETSMNTFIEKYNELVTLIDNEVYSTDSNIDDKSSLKDILDQIKDKLFGSYGTSTDTSVFNYGFELDKEGTGILSLDSTTFNAALDENPEALRAIFIGTAENEGFGTQVKALIDEMGFTTGVIGLYESSLQSREETLDDELETAIETLDDKYTQLSAQFGSYAALITSYESSFSGLQLMIDQSTASS